MNCKRTLALFVTMGILLLGVGQVTGQQAGPQNPQGTYGYAFTYQGQLQDAGGPVNGACDLRFILWNAASGGSQVGNTLTLEGVEIEDGLFTARLDFGGGAHSGAARWLEVDVRCPAGVGDYVPLDPRQELTGAPAALSLALPFLAEANIGGPLACFENEGDGEAAVFSSAGGYALWVATAGLTGLYIDSAGQDGVRVVNAGGRGVAVDTAGGDGVYVSSAGGRGLAVDTAGDDGVYVGAAMNNGVTVGSAGGTGVFVGSTVNSGVLVDSAGAYGVYVGSAGMDGVGVSSAGWRGVSVGSAGDDGVYVFSAGNPSTNIFSAQKNGFEVAGAEGSGLYVGRADDSGVEVHSAGIGVTVHSADAWGVYVGSAGGHGVQVGSAADYGVIVNSAGNVGVYVGSAGDNGVTVGSAGSPSNTYFGASHDGFEVQGAEGYGLRVGRADLDGVYVNSAAWHGLNVAGAGVNGLYVSSAGNNGVDVTGNNYAGTFHGDINVTGNCIGCALAVFGLNAGDRPLEPGQIVAIEGIQATTLDNAPALWRVVPAGEGSAAVGVVRGRAVLDEAPEGQELRPGETGRRLVPRDGAARPGEYLSIVIYGPMQVKVGAAAGSIRPGTRLVVGGSGAARALKTVVVEGLTLAESAPVLGIALDAPDENGLVWVLVNPQ